VIGKNNMKLLINNLGSIRNNNQAIDLTKKFYTFIGYNNSGKTLVSQLLWTIFNHDNIRPPAKVLFSYLIIA